MRFPAKKNGGCTKALRNFPPRKDGILPVGLPWDSPPPPTESVRTVGRVGVRRRQNQNSSIDRLPDFLTHGASRAGVSLIMCRDTFYSES